MFALHLHDESDEKVTLKRLPLDDSQYQRCRRATLENVKAQFFNDTTFFTGLVVLDIFKLENQVLLHRFQKEVAADPSTKVKGLFTVVDFENVPRVVTFGFGEQEPTESQKSSLFRGSAIATNVLSAAAEGAFEQGIAGFDPTQRSGTVAEDRALSSPGAQVRC